MASSSAGVLRNVVLLSVAVGTLTAASLMRMQIPPAASQSVPVQSATVGSDAASIGRWLWPGAFEALIGSASTQASFTASGRRYVAEVRSDGLMIRRGTDVGATAEVRFTGARTKVRALPGDPAAGPLSLFTGSRAGAITTHWQRYSAVTFEEVYPGIAARFRATGGDLELDFLVAAGADPRRIELSVDRGTTFSVDDKTSDILIVRGQEQFRLRRARAYQSSASGQAEVPIRVALDGDRLHFELGDYDRARPLLIDPLVATWSTLVGTVTDAMYDDAAAVATDSQGNLYVAGSTQFDLQFQPPDTFPTTPTSLNPPYSRSPGNSCAFQCGYVLKLSPDHQVLYGALIYGFTISAIAVDPAGQAYITGSTLDSTDFPATPGVFSNDPTGQAFVAKLSGDGSSFVYSALFAAGSGNGIAADDQGNAYVVGVASSSLPTTAGSVKPVNPPASNNTDGYLLKINPAGSALVFGTYLGGSGRDTASSVQIDAQYEAVVAGQTASNDFVGLPQAIVGTSDAFVLKVSADGAQILGGKIFGGSGDEVVNGVTADGQGGWIMCGDTTSADFPVSGNAQQTRLLGQRNGWVQRVDGAFTTIYATYFGGSAIDGCLNVASDAAANAYLVGVTFSTDLTTTPDAYQDQSSAITNDYLAGIGDQFFVTPVLNAVREAYFAELSSNGSLLYGSFAGGYITTPPGYPPLTIGTGITNSPSGTIYISGATSAISFPVTDGGLRNGMGGQADGFIVAFAPSALSITTPSLLPAAPIQIPYSVTLTASGGTAPYTWSKVGFEIPNGLSLSSSGVLSGSASNTQQETTGYQFTVKVIDANGQIAYKNFFLNLGFASNFQCNKGTCVAALSTGNQIVYQVPALARGVPPETFVQTGQLPPGLAVSATGALTGSPTATGEYKFGFQVTDAAGQSGVVNFDVMVGSDATANATIKATPTSVPVGQSIALAWSSYFTSGCVASGGGADGSPWTGPLPVFGSTTITATQAGSYNYKVDCYDGAGSPLHAQAAVSVTNPTSGGPSGGGGGGGGGGSLSLEILVLAVAVARRYRRREI
jgi:hypothetical protein